MNKENVKTVIIVVLAVVISFIVGKGYNSYTVGNLINENVRMSSILKQTEVGLNQLNWNEQALSYWKGLNYKFEPKSVVPQPTIPPTEAKSK